LVTTVQSESSILSHAGPIYLCAAKCVRGQSGGATLISHTHSTVSHNGAT